MLSFDFEGRTLRIWHVSKRPVRLDEHALHNLRFELPSNIRRNVPKTLLIDNTESTLNERYSVQVTKDYLVFSAAHFITFAGNVCERLHGHNYKVSCEIFGPLDENHYVIDFIALRDALKAIVDELDHHMLLPTEHKTIHVVPNDKKVEVTFADRRWVFPREDCVLLPVANTTTELLARFIGRRLLEVLKEKAEPLPERMRIGVDENEGQWGFCDMTP